MIEMRPSDEIHNYPNVMERLVARINSDSDLLDENRKATLKFRDHLISLGLSLARQTKYLSTVLLIAKRLKKDFCELTRDDITEFVKSIELSAYSEWTKHDYKVVFKIFYRWLKKCNIYPDEVSWIKCKKGENDLVPEDLISMEDLRKLVDAAQNQRDRAFILVLFDSACRIGEILSLRLRFVSFDGKGAQLLVKGKTGSRRVRIIASEPALSKWINNHPFKDNPDSPLWVCLEGKGRGQLMTYPAALKLVRSLTKRAGITKRIYPHLFRHSRATMLAKHLPEALLNHHGGWVQGSQSGASYVHVSGRDVDRELFRMQGVIMEERDEQDEFKILTCAKCAKKSSPFSKSCDGCGLPFSVSSTERVDELRQKADNLVSALMNNEEVLDKLLSSINTLSSSR